MGLWWGGYSQPRLQLLYEKCIGILFDTSIDYLFWFLCDYVKSTLSWSIQASSWTWWASSWTPMSWLQLWRTSTKTSKSRSRMVMMITCEKWSMMRIGRCEFCQNVAVSTTGLVSLSSMSLSPWAPGARKNKTQCRLCKRLAGPIIPFSNLGTPLVWSYLARSAVVWPMAFWSLGCSHQPFACILSNYGDWQIKTGDASATLLLTSEKAVFCNNVIIEIEIDSFKTK